MDCSVSTKTFKDALALLSSVSGEKAYLPVLSFILAEAEGSCLRLTATDIQVGITIEIGASVSQPGKVLLQTSTISNLVKQMRGDKVQILATDESVTIVSKPIKAKINTLDVDEFPPIKHLSGGGLSLPAEQLKMGLSIAGSSVADGDSRPVLASVYIKADGDKLEFAAANGFSLAVVKFPNSGDMGDVLLPSSAASLVARTFTGEVSVCTDGSIVTFTSGSTTITSQTVDGRFPDYAAIIPPPKGCLLELGSLSFDNAIKAASVYAKDSAWSGRLTVKSNGTASLFGKSAERGDVECEITPTSTNNEPLDVSFSLALMGQFLKTLPASDIQFSCNGSENPIRLNLNLSDEGEVTYVIMPMSKS